MTAGAEAVSSTTPDHDQGIGVLQGWSSGSDDSGSPSRCDARERSGFPGISRRIPFENGFISEVLLENGYNTYCVGKWHLTPGEETGMAAWKKRWPLGRGFERFYGFLGGEQFPPDSSVL